MKRNAIILIIIAALVVGAIAVQLIKGKGEKPNSIEDIQKAEGVPVNVLEVAPSRFERWRTFSGEIEGKQQAVLYSNISARVRKVHRKQGDKVGRGSLIISLDPLSASQTYSAQRVAKIHYTAANRTYNRMLPLFKAGAISKEDFDKVKVGLAVAKAGLTDTSYLTALKAPIRGTLTDLRVSPGDKVEVGNVLAVVADISGSKLIMNVSQSDVEELETGQPVVIGKEKSTRKEISADSKITKISLSADMMTRLFRTEINLGKDGKVRPGTLQFVQVLTYQADNVISVPIASVITRNDQTYVYLVTPNNKSEKRIVTIGKTNDTNIEIISGISTGDRVVVWGQNRLTGGEKINVIKTKQTITTENNNNDPA